GAPGSALALALPAADGPGAVPAEYGPYLRRFRQRVLESLVYPLAARRQGLGGTVELHVWLEPTGRVRDVQIARSSSHPVLDDAAVEAIRRLGPVPFPDSLPRRPLLIRVPLVFELR
ncbi:MAG TPA: energy transducer TonB, partial [Methylomirabilota bacterium]|nr:energy transducer TonB [Methylomirabilota bacterium]